MLKLKNICKSYTTGSFTQKALNNVSIDFNSNEFVAILGASGSGKTTCLNIIGGLDRYDSGDIEINGISTKKFKDKDWDAYRNNSIGFVFQNYNLITHISVLANVEMCMTLSGISKKERKKKAYNALEKVGLKDHAHKKPNQLSGGQMQRVAIARALVNEPDIILADEPTGALDSITSIQIMELIAEIAKDKLVIMVTHNPELAKKYANRIITLKDGEIENDTINNVSTCDVKTKEKIKKEYKLKRTSMSFFTAISLSFTNIWTKKGRTILTAFASSIGIIGIALILSLSNGFDIQIDQFEANTLNSFPIIVSQSKIDVDTSQLEERRNNILGIENNTDAFPTTDNITAYDSLAETMVHSNNITQNYLDYLNKINAKNISGISYTYVTSINMLTKNLNNEITTVKSSALNLQTLPKNFNESYNSNSYLTKKYDILSGNLPQNDTDLILVVDKQNRINTSILEALGITLKAGETINFNELVGKEYKIILNDLYYSYMESHGIGYYMPNQDLESMYNSTENVLSVKICGIFRVKEDEKVAILTEGIVYQAGLIDTIVDNNRTSKIVEAQLDSDVNILTRQSFAVGQTDNTNETTKDTFLNYLGYSKTPYAIYIYPNNFDAKDEVCTYLDEYNLNIDDDKQVIYTDLADTFSSLSGNIMSAITTVLIAFSAISLVVSVIMIGIITYISVLERTKEIGILRALGARKRDITRVFNAETSIIGLSSGIMGIVIAYILIFPANIILYNLTNLENVAKLNIFHAIFLVATSLILTIIGGFIPAKIAAKKDPVEALRSE